MPQVGINCVLQNAFDEITDREAYERDLHLVKLAEPLGFEKISAVEHHFNNYSMGPDNVALLAWLAGQTSTIELMTGAVILPWNNPLRVVERMILLDHLSQGRAHFGIGRGLARREYEAFGIDMNESRDRFNEAAKMVIEGVETGFVEGDGPYYKQKRTEVRPRPYKSFKDRITCVAMSPDTVPIAAELGARMTVFAQKPWAEMVGHFETYHRLFREAQGRDAPAPTCTEFVFCDSSADRAEEMAMKYIGNYYDILIDHYEFGSKHFSQTKGYSGYATAAEKVLTTAHEQLREAYVRANNFGTPNQILENYEKRRALIGDFDIQINVTYGGLSLQDAEGNLRLYAEKVLPELKSWQREAA
ncbi:alkanesulfonate monooxygenase SsuD/methylene tetrahydromethanopterin reductase-like flavin-dependent oxidoreductase (luciferase family) [Rhodoligotrophos appendicifer]|uniref:LLM class flavin-dependent oxidoreductase n=1 Tax=Rhodoligotrophos appendicifer TaxID=987056 RepID=UPI00147881BC|nr:LLM class flavin-dependent oxidoreductase [Rhodoligotrophos appendicifer]